MKTIVLYGSEMCHKTKYYMNYLTERNLEFTFHDVIKDKDAAVELKNLYETKRLNFPTLLIADKKLRNPTDSALNKWL